MMSELSGGGGGGLILRNLVVVTSLSGMVDQVCVLDVQQCSSTQLVTLLIIVTPALVDSTRLRLKPSSNLGDRPSSN